MSSTFSGFDIARKALSVSQKAMETTGHNIANANTPGYTRQRLVVASVEATGHRAVLPCPNAALLAAVWRP